MLDRVLEVRFMIPPFAIYLSSEFVCHKIYDLGEYGEDYNYSLYSTKNYSTLECFFLEFYSCIKNFSVFMFKINNCIITSCVLLQLHYTWNVDVLGKSTSKLQEFRKLQLMFQKKPAQVCRFFPWEDGKKASLPCFTFD